MSPDVRYALARRLIEPVRHSWKQLALITLVFVILAFAYFPDHTEVSSAFFWQWVEPVTGIMAFLVSVVVLYNQTRDRWESSLERRLTVSFVNASDEREVARVENAYLSGESDIRQWAQQLGLQIFGEHLQLDMNWDDLSPSPNIEREMSGGLCTFVKVYRVKLFVYFKHLPREKLNEFTTRRFKHSYVEGSADQLPLIWRRRAGTGSHDPLVSNVGAGEGISE